MMLRHWVRPRFMSARWFVGAAALIGLGYLVVHVLGWRVYVTVLSGTFVSDHPMLDLARAAAYMCFYFGAVVAGPVLVIAGGIVWGAGVGTVGETGVLGARKPCGARMGDCMRRI